MAQTKLLRIHDNGNGRREEEIDLTGLERALEEGAKIAIAYVTPGGKAGQIPWNKEIVLKTRQRVAPTLRYRWEDADDPR